MSSDSEITSYYPYEPNHVLPAIFAALVGMSLLIHVWQNFYHRYWRVMFFMCWGGTIFTIGWILRATATYQVGNKDLYIAQTILILCGPPIYSAAEYNVLGRLMHYLPMHAPLNPSRVVYFFVYLGVAVECVTALGAARLAAAGDDKSMLKSGAACVAAGAVLQSVVECVFMGMVGGIHYRCTRAGMVTQKVRIICVTIYGTSALILLRSIFRAVEKFSILRLVSSDTCDGTCNAVIRHEWYLYAFEAAPMVLYTYWLNIMHPGRFLPQKSNVYLDFNRIERVGPGWMDGRATWQTFVDIFDMKRSIKGKSEDEKFWLRPDDWPVLARGTNVVDGMDATSTTGNKHGGTGGANV
ncbi:hypothetical protein AJ80_00510 [Polytolypa hystricis UAMH7299]|uniref:RTA1 domain-containing protein n=1 Tax=Polytolypa hystricis (strain UAMH7299) TaxID=1447883 RepID=A0A2B7Z3B8_POLH7|nr:hypothetical protein AJ80_00510 [Polytolypa hystricis UAMH7299]